ncbi:hypothetical protein EOE67_15955 [Rheinheimera riviphila]|uniref:DUF3649 domain-containing protein n=1 Tax=Rheinheimera riviphila TaxID=1834037 RepID=A0A437QIZ9_9GAMM|nr:hypothetical protein [Rheinheimera riviphila]RVU34360.1 hypothetical protein EOE67_15955 [Rheinheimera riviphila]
MKLDLSPMASAPPATAKRPWWQVASLVWRILLATVGGYVCTVALTSLSARLCAVVFGLPLASSLLSMMLLSFLLYSITIMAVFASQRLGRTSLWLLGTTAAAMLLCQLPALSGVAETLMTTGAKVS